MALDPFQTQTNFFATIGSLVTYGIHKSRQLHSVVWGHGSAAERPFAALLERVAPYTSREAIMDGLTAGRGKTYSQRPAWCHWVRSRWASLD